MFIGIGIRIGEPEAEEAGAGIPPQPDQGDFDDDFNAEFD